MSGKHKVAVVGLGSMGFGVAQSVLRAGHETFGYDINADAVARFLAEGGQACQRPAPELPVNR